MRLAFLVFAPNPKYVKVVEQAPEGVKVFPDKGMWTWSSAYTQPLRKIGESRHIGDERHGIIGVYDLDDIKQVDLMVHHAVDTRRNYSSAN